MKPFLFFIFCFKIQFVLAQFPNILIDDNGNPNEPSIWVNPKNVQNIVAGANLNFTYQSADGGLSWQKNNVTCDWGVWGDPCIISDTSENFYFIHLSNPPGGSWIDRIICQKSTDNGLTWSNGSYTGLNGIRDQDKAWAVYDPLTKNIYMTWTQFDTYASNSPGDSAIILFSKSTDQGITWTEPVRINRQAGNCLDSDYTPEGAVPTVGSDGKIYVAWSFNDTIWFDRSADQGDSWLVTDIAATAHSGGWDYNIPGLYRSNGMPVTKCDLSNSIYNGTIYINWSDQRNGADNTDVFIAKSIDGGNTWSTAVKVNDDNTETHQFMSWMDIDQADGMIWIVFYDRRNYSDKNTDVFLAYSADGGETFTNVKISESPFIPNAITFLGDYNNISAYGGKIAPIWTREDNLQTSVWTAQIEVTTLTEAMQTLLPSHFLLFQNTPNPFSETTSIGMAIPVSDFYTLTLFDMTGKKITDLILDEFLEQGHHKIVLAAKQLGLRNSAYYYSLRRGNETVTKKLIFISQ
ncbi:MAG: hypothetical protein ABIQ74_06375 [Chitinophagales bacterium]